MRHAAPGQIDAQAPAGDGVVLAATFMAAVSALVRPAGQGAGATPGVILLLISAVAVGGHA